MYFKDEETCVSIKGIWLSVMVHRVGI